MTTITSDFFEEYTEFINGLQNRIMKIQLKYNECQSLISRDFSKGFIAKEVAEKMLAVRINQFVPSMDRMYRLSKEEIDFINQYAALDTSGNVLATILKPEYLQKAELLERIKKSVKTFDYYEKLDPESKRIKIKQELVTTFTRRMEALQNKAQNILRVRGANAENSSAYQQLQTEIIKCNNALESFDQIMEYDDELLIKLFSSFYQIDYYYYDWYTKMELRSLKESDELYKEHTVTTGKAVKTATDLYEGQTTLRENYDKLQKLNNELISFLESIIDFDIEEFEDEHTQSIGLFKKSKKSVNNMETILELFTQLSLLPGTQRYLQETFYKDETQITMEECFDRYFNSKYNKERKYVDLYNFLLTFKKQILAFYKKEIATLQKTIDSQIKINGGIVVVQGNVAEKAHNQAILQQKVYNAATYDLNSLKKDGCTEEELEKIFRSLQAMLTPTYSFGNPADSKRKK